MRNIIFIILVFVSCSKKTENGIRGNIKAKKLNITEKEFKSQLIKEDFFKYSEQNVDINKIDSLDIYNENTNKFAAIDAEELAEFSFDYFVPQLVKMLSKRNITLIVEKTDNTEKMREISINGEKIILYTEEELDNETFWNSAANNFFKKLNEILKLKKSDERFYLVNGGNDLSTFLLTDHQVELFQRRYESEVSEIPRNP
ncbi:hypothetical protein [Flavobacterium cerinum]|uniref:Lipoprotein n=1 Tax=Flavobacterium cerinum TaxID=2502784 RepID=A0ABY5IPQ4_9FLAO|nr:hypothetical protein [Flavobacterium cerinum]UUC44739.1 hypothetical protein NOX80_14010 [Flavobacterium cerinum]